MDGELLGGPLDGSKIAQGARPSFVFCAPAARVGGEPRARVFTEAKDGRFLYRMETVKGRHRFVYAGHLYCQCPPVGGCGAYLRVGSATCKLCGATLETGATAA